MLLALVATVTSCLSPIKPNCSLCNPCNRHSELSTDLIPPKLLTYYLYWARRTSHGKRNTLTGQQKVGRKIAGLQTRPSQQELAAAAQGSCSGAAESLQQAGPVSIDINAAPPSSAIRLSPTAACNSFGGPAVPSLANTAPSTPPAQTKGSSSATKSSTRPQQLILVNLHNVSICYQRHASLLTMASLKISNEPCVSFSGINSAIISGLINLSTIPGLLDENGDMKYARFEEDTGWVR